ncbi:PD-(D/E)XK nuclease family protein [Mariprofundus ferrooxydans]|nr:PD-(D/E)XK nuclease family protein [Mariprofundus ferrooxydans]MBN4077056.1 PD-(D/E)XK nuclease family protein [Mariprofundus ferrooxydans]
MSGGIINTSEIDFSVGLSNFVVEWNAISDKYSNGAHPLSVLLPQFISEWEKLPTRPPVTSRKISEVTYNALHRFIADFSPAINKFRETGVQANVWAIAGLKHNEVRISSVLNWFLSPNATHGQSSKICFSLLSRIEKLTQGNDQITSAFPKASDLHDKENEDIARYTSTTEVCPYGKQDNRVDIILDGTNLLLYIEVKIDAPQGREQLQRYHELAKACHAGRNWGVVYLTPKGILPDDAKQLENCIAISWSEVADVFRKSEKTLEYSHLSRHYIGQFAQYVSKF